MQTYAERLTPPVALWVAVWVGAAFLGISFYAALGPAAGLLAMLVPGVLLSVVLVRSAALVRVVDGDRWRGRPASPCGSSGRWRCSTRPRPARCAGRRRTRLPTT